MIRSLFLLSLSASLTFASPSPTPAPGPPSLSSLQKRDNNGNFRWYSPALVGNGACGFQNVDSDSVVAVDQTLWNTYARSNNISDNELCGSTVFVTYQQVTRQATITDYCLDCNSNQNDLYLSSGLFNQLTDPKAGSIPGTWRFSVAPTPTSKPAVTSTYASTSCSETGFGPTSPGPDPADCQGLLTGLQANFTGTFWVEPLTVYGFVNKTCALQFCNYNAGYTVAYDWVEFLQHGNSMLQNFIINPSVHDSLSQCLWSNGSGYIQLQNTSNLVRGQGSYPLSGRQFC